MELEEKKQFSLAPGKLRALLPSAICSLETYTYRGIRIEELVEIIFTQQEVIEYLKQEIEKLKASRDRYSKTSSKPPSLDLLKKSEKKKKPGGQPGG